MRRLTLAAAALALTAGLAAAQTESADRMDKQGSNQTYNSGPLESGVGGDRAHATREQNRDASRAGAYDAPGRDSDKGKGVATGFIAAGLGLALLGLFVRRRRTHSGRYDDADIHRPGGGPRL